MHKFQHPQVTFPDAMILAPVTGAMKSGTQEVWGYPGELVTYGHTYRVRFDECKDFPVGQAVDAMGELRPGFKGDTQIWIHGWKPQK